MLFLASAKLFAQNITVQINPGEQWNKRVPQCAIWLEDENNNYIDTIFFDQLQLLQWHLIGPHLEQFWLQVCEQVHLFPPYKKYFQ